MTARTEHTPGPWHANGIAGTRIVGDENSACEKIHINGGNRTIARVYRSADATLIKAAPALLAACEQAAEHFRDTDAPLGDMLRAAIAQARGSK